MGRSPIVTISRFLLVSFAVLACSQPAVTPGPTATPGKTEIVVPAQPAWEQDWEGTLSEAKKEGKVVIYTPYGVEWRQALGNAMISKFGIIADVLIASGAQVSQRVMMEQKTRTNQADVLVTSSSEFVATYQPQGILQSLDKVLILPEVVDPKVWWNGDLPWFDPDTKTGLYFYSYISPPITVNADLVKPDEMTSWKHVLNPKWKGRILLKDPTVSGGGQKHMVMLAYGIMDWDFIREFMKQDPVISRDERLLVEWVARGKFPISIDGSRELIYSFKNEGAPLRQVVPVEGAYVQSGNGNIYFPKGAPNPNAAKIFMNFLLSREGQTLSSKATGMQSGRIDVPTDHMDPIMVRQPGMKYIETNDKEYLEKSPAVVAKIIEMFKPLVQ